MSAVQHAGQEDFETKVVNADKPTLVDFWAEWCGPCKMLGPILDEVASELGEKVNIVKVNVDENGPLAGQFGVRGIPTMVFFNKGQAVKSLVGVQPKEEIKKSLEELL